MLGLLSTTRSAERGSRRKFSRPESAIKLLGYLMAMASIAAAIAMLGIKLISAFVI